MRYAWIVAALLAGCTVQVIAPEPMPLEVPVEVVATEAPTPEPIATVNPTPTPIPTPSPTPTPKPTPSPTPTPEPVDTAACEALTADYQFDLAVLDQQYQAQIQEIETAYAQGRVTSDQVGPSKRNVEANRDAEAAKLEQAYLEDVAELGCD